MEADNVDIGGAAAEGASATSRWNPTKEQISMLEGLYRQGIRTPSADQIQQITSRLRAYGHIEGKNVFYWFQNHKARQRQKQKQESMAYINRYFHRTPQPIFAPCPNAICSPYYLPQSDIGFYPQYHNPKVLLTGGIRRRPRTEKLEKSRSFDDDTPVHMAGNSQKTLPLFPLHPTGNLQGETGKCSIGSSSAMNSTNTPSFSDQVEEGSGDQLFFDFFSGDGSCESG
ncbi:hypothetical protein FH972_011485 [Carpinus fangiana]|uniref:Homeobox domain-containing protein n=1 Tax=Carpinus fangiana TaxID=176857 RepID=A0A660KUK0_9ROSI|nr:hypothetical protein FH972_011485 [Carpinus fangiana]